MEEFKEELKELMKKHKVMFWFVEDYNGETFLINTRGDSARLDEFESRD